MTTNYAEECTKQALWSGGETVELLPSVVRSLFTYRAVKQMSDQKGGTGDVYVNLELLLFQLSHTRVALQRLSKSMIAMFLTKEVTAVRRVFHADTVIEIKYHQSEGDAIKSIESHCPVCKRKEPLDKLQRRNCRTCRKRLTFQCLRCQSEKLNSGLVSLHVRDRIIFYCSICGFCTTKSWELRKHTQSVHNKKLVFQCGRCDKAFNIINGLHNHERYCGKAATISCAMCARKFKLRSDLELHVKRMHLKTE